MGVYIAAFRWPDWAGLLIVALIALFVLLIWVVNPLVMLTAAYFERITLRPLELADASATAGKNVSVVDEALRAGLQYVGTFMDRQGQILANGISMLLSPDRLTRLSVVHSRTHRYALTTRLQSGRRIRTVDVSGVADLSGIEDTQMLPRVPFDVVLYYHQQRVAAAGEPVVAFDPDTLAAEELASQRERAARMVGMGLARYRDPGQQVWSYSLRGALQITLNYMRALSHVQQRANLAKAKAAEFEQWRLREGRTPLGPTVLRR